MNVSFGASFLNYANIKKVSDTPEKTYNDKEVAFVELDTSDYNDMRAINCVANRFEISKRKGNNYAQQIRQDYDSIFVKQKNDNNRRFFTITEQGDSFEYLDSKKILGAVETSEKGDTATIRFLQVDPKTNYYSKNRTAKGVGKAILDSIINLFKNKNIYVLPDFDAVDFYLQYGFKPTHEGSRVLVYRQKSST